MHDDGAEEDGRDKKHLMEDQKKDRENEPDDQDLYPPFLPDLLRFLWDLGHQYTIVRIGLSFQIRFNYRSFAVRSQGKFHGDLSFLFDRM